MLVQSVAKGKEVNLTKSEQIRLPSLIDRDEPMTLLHTVIIPLAGYNHLVAKWE